jgi:hypothetical protein
MSQVLTEIPSWAKDVDSLGRPAKYPWRDWLDGETHLLVRGTNSIERFDGLATDPDMGDYQTESRFFRHTVIRAAEKRNIDVFVAVHAGRNYEDKRDRMIIRADSAESATPVLEAGPDPAVPERLNEFIRGGTNSVR